MTRRRLVLGGVTLLGLIAAVAVAIGSRDSRPDASGEEPRAADASPTGANDERGAWADFFVVDVHVHASPDSVDRLRGLMNRWGFDHVVNLSGGHPLRGLRSQLAAAGRSGGRITVFTTLAYEQAAREGYGERMARALEIAHAMGAKGLKIAKVLGVGLEGPDGELLPVDDAGLDPVFEAAGRLGMPVAIHSGDPKAFWDPVEPSNERYAELRAHPGWALHGEDVPSFDEILAQLERRIARHPKTTFISVHFGNAAEEPDRVARMLRQYPNLYIDTATRIPEMGRHDPKKMRAFFIEFQDRILFGSDLGVGPDDTPLFLGSEGDEPADESDEVRFFTATRRYFHTADRSFPHPTPIQGDWDIDGIDLPRDVLEKIYSKNAIRVLGLTIRPDVAATDPTP